MTKQTNAELAWDKYLELCKKVTTVDDCKGAFIQAVEAAFLTAKGTDPEEWKPTFEGADPKSQDLLNMIYETMEKDIAVDALGSIAECVYSVQAGMFNPSDLPPNSVELQLMVFGVVAENHLKNALSSLLAGRKL